MEEGEADLAIVYSNIAMPSNGLTIAVFRRDNLLLIVPGNSPVDSYQGLAGKKVGLLLTDSPERNASLSRLLDSVLSFYNISPDKVQREYLSSEEIGPAIAKNRVAGLMALGPTGPGAISKAIATIGNVTKTSPRLIGDKQAPAMAKTIQGTEPTKIDEGAFGGDKPKPDEALKTLAVTMRLVGRHTLPDFATGEIARLLTLAKARLIATSPLARDIEAPDSEDGSGLPIHPGAAAYFEGEQDSLLDSAFSVFYLISIILGVFGSGVVWLFSAGKKDPPAGEQLEANRLLCILRDARNADLASLDRMEAEIDEAVTRLLEHGEPVDSTLVDTIAIVMDRLANRRAVVNRLAAGRA